jgi:hypothetical protein
LALDQNQWRKTRINSLTSMETGFSDAMQIKLWVWWQWAVGFELGKKTHPS